MAMYVNIRGVGFTLKTIVYTIAVIIHYVCHGIHTFNYNFKINIKTFQSTAIIKILPFCYKMLTKHANTSYAI